MSGLCENDGWSADTLLFLIIGRHTYCARLEFLEFLEFQEFWNDGW